MILKSTKETTKAQKAVRLLSYAIWGGAIGVLSRFDISLPMSIVYSTVIVLVTTIITDLIVNKLQPKQAEA